MNFCSETAEIWQLVGNIVTIIKIVIPLIIIVLAVIDLGKAAVSSDEKQMKGAFSTLIRRVIAGVLIFFIPTLITLCFSIIGEFSDDLESDYSVCAECVSSPSSCQTGDETGSLDVDND